MASKPNVVLVLVDDMGYGDFSAFNDGRSDTPTLDSLIDESVCFTQQYCASCVCAPSRAGLMTGRYPHRTGAIDTLDARGLDRLALREVTMGDMFGANGYATGLIGKWHLGAADPRYHPNERGFDEFIGFRGGWWDYWDWTLDYNGTFKESDGRYLTDVFTDEAIGFIDRHSDEPFFLHLTYNAPHGPFQCPDEDVQPFREKGEFNEGVCILYGMLKRMDTGMAKILQALEDRGIADNTILMFTSDNGPQWGAPPELGTIRRFNCGFNGQKGTVYEGGIRVPMIVRWPDGVEGGKTLDDVTHFMDWYPSLAYACDLQMPQGPHLDGVNRWPLLEGEKPQDEPIRCWQWNRYTPVLECNAAVRDGDWKLVRPRIDEAMKVFEEDLEMDRATKEDPATRPAVYTGPEPDRDIPEPPAPQLFDIADDPEESVDLAHLHPDRVRRMRNELEDWFEQVEAERATIDDEW